MKALILAGGRGSRLGDYTQGNNKCMYRVAGKPAIEYSLDNAVAAGVDCAVVVVGYRAEDIINHYGTSYLDLPLRYVIQWQQHGLVHAIETASHALAGDDFMLMLGDEIMLNPRHADMLVAHRASSSFATCGLLEVQDTSLVSKTYAVMRGADGSIYRLVEKPKNPLNSLMGTGDCIFDNRILDYIAITPVHHQRNEKELPDLIQCAVDDGQHVGSFLVCDAYSNINCEEDVVLAEEILRGRRL